MHRNPLGIAGVRSPRDHRWSSYRTYLGLRPCPTFLERQPVMDLVGGRIDELVAATEAETPTGPATTDDLMRLVKCARAADDLAGGSGDQPTANIDRTLLVLLEHRTDDVGLRQLIGDALGPRPHAAGVRARHRAEARLRDDPGIGRILGWLQRQLATTSAA